MTPDRIVFVYNADHGLFSAVAGWAHKLLSPQTYQCALCRVTFGLTGMLVSWKNFIKWLPCPSVFLYRDEFRAQHPELAVISPPFILVEANGASEILVSADELKACSGLTGLIGLVQVRLEEWGSAKAAPIAPSPPSTR